MFKKLILFISILVIPLTSFGKTSWERIQGEEGDKNWVLSLSAVSSSNIWILGAVDNNGNGEVRGYRSTNGNSFAQFTLPVGSGAMNMYSSIAFMDANVGFLSGVSIDLPFKDGFDLSTNIVWRSTNGGSSWELLDDALDEMITKLQVLPSGELFGISPSNFYYLDGSTMTVGGLIETGGLTINTLHMLNSTTGFIAGGQGKSDDDPNQIPGKGFVFKTSDGGLNWVPVKSGLNFNITAIYFINEDVGYIGGDDGTTAYLMITTDGGQTFTSQSLPMHPEFTYDINFKFSQTVEAMPPTSLSEIKFFDCDRGVALGNICTGNCDSADSDPTFLTMFMRTYDGGVTWEMDPDYEPAMEGWGQLSMVPKKLSGMLAMDFPSPNYGFIGGQNLMVLKYAADTPEEEPSPGIPDCSGGNNNNNNTNNSGTNNNSGFNDPNSSDSGCSCNNSNKSGVNLDFLLIFSLISVIVLKRHLF